MTKAHMNILCQYAWDLYSSITGEVSGWEGKYTETQILNRKVFFNWHLFVKDKLVFSKEVSLGILTMFKSRTHAHHQYVANSKQIQCYVWTYYFYHIIWAWYLLSYILLMYYGLWLLFLWDFCVGGYVWLCLCVCLCLVLSLGSLFCFVLHYSNLFVLF